MFVANKDAVSRMKSANTGDEGGVLFIRTISIRHSKMDLSLLFITILSGFLIMNILVYREQSDFLRMSTTVRAKARHETARADLNALKSGLDLMDSQYVVRGGHYERE